MQPEIVPRRNLAASWLAALAVSIAIALILPFLTFNLDGKTLGDTDDAVRLILVRNLLAGQGWFDVTVKTIAPPRGLEMHWSRLIDGGIAGLDLFFGLFVTPSMAELLARAIWPMLWIFPAVASAAFVARRLAGDAAIILAYILCISSFVLYVQFVPGRIDHHGPQIALMMVGLASLSAIGSHRLAPVAAGAAMALQLAVGLEAVVLPLAGAAWLGLRCAIQPDLRQDLRRFAASLGIGILLLHIAQTGPTRWLLPACDMLGANFALAIAAGCLVIVLGTFLAGELWTRLAWLAGAAAVAGVVFIMTEPACLRGPFAMVDPAVKPIWLDRVQEMQNIARMMKKDFIPALGFIILPVLALGALCWLLIERHRHPLWLLASAYLIVATLMGASAIRLTSYAMWCAVPVMAAAIVVIASRLAGSSQPRLVWMALAAIFLSPNIIMSATELIGTPLGLSTTASPLDTKRCATPDAYRALDQAPPGLILAEVDRGPFIGEFTHHSAFTAPYHRIDKSILAALTILKDDPANARPKIQASAIDYVLVCPESADGKKGTTGFLRQLESGQIPPWLAQVPAGDPFRLYRVIR